MSNFKTVKVINNEESQKSSDSQEEPKDTW